MASTPGTDAAGEVAAPETRRDRGRDDDLGQGVGQGALETVADLDAHPALARRDQEEGAVVLVRPADPPVAEQPVGVILDGQAAQARHGGDHHLIGGALLVRLELLLDGGPVFRPQHVRGIDDAAAERRKRRLLRRRRDHGQDEERQSRKHSSPLAGEGRCERLHQVCAQKRTCGGRSDPAVAVKVSMGRDSGYRTAAIQRPGMVRSSVL